jgi:hypothetical protein
MFIQDKLVSPDSGIDSKNPIFNEYAPISGNAKKLKQKVL